MCGIIIIKKEKVEGLWLKILLVIDNFDYKVNKGWWQISMLFSEESVDSSLDIPK